MNRFPCFFLSLCLHALVVALVIFWPAGVRQEPVRGAMVAGMVTLGKAGKASQEGRRAIPKADGSQRQKKGSALEKPRNEGQEAKRTAAVESPEKPQPRPEVKPVPKPSPEKTAPPETPSDAIPIPKDVEAPKAEKKKTEKKDTDAPSPDSERKRQPETAPKEQDVNKALADLDKQVGKEHGKSGGGKKAGSQKGDGQDLSSVLADLGKSLGGAGDDNAGSGPGGSGGDGYGVLGAYQDSVISRVRPNWSWPGRTDRRSYTAVVNIRIDAKGAIQNVRMVSSSGNNFFDATVIRALNATENLEPPPHPDFMDMNISFTPEALSGL